MAVRSAKHMRAGIINMTRAPPNPGSAIAKDVGPTCSRQYLRVVANSTAYGVHEALATGWTIFRGKPRLPQIIRRRSQASQEGIGRSGEPDVANIAFFIQETEAR
jgi:hypothetical protein